HISYTIVLAETADRAGILAALKKRHCYAATDNIVVDLRSGDHIMGEELKAFAAPVLQMHVIGTAPLARIDVVKDGEVVDVLRPDGREYRGAWHDPRPAEGMHYYYIRVVQADRPRSLAWATPLWIECVLPE